MLDLTTRQLRFAMDFGLVGIDTEDRRMSFTDLGEPIRDGISLPGAETLIGGSVMISCSVVDICVCANYSEWIGRSAFRGKSE